LGLDDSNEQLAEAVIGGIIHVWGIGTVNVDVREINLHTSLSIYDHD
jgi:hypothetical protein